MRSEQFIAAADFPAHAFHGLINERRGLKDFILTEVEHQAALGVEGDAVGTRKVEGDRFGRGARRHGEIIFQTLLVAVVQQGDAGIDLRDLHPGKGGDTSPPLCGLAAGEVIDRAG